MKFIGVFPYWDEERLDNLEERGKYAQALTEVNKAVELYPNKAEYIGRRGCIHERLGNYAPAKADYEQAYRLRQRDDARSGWTENNLAWILATAPEPELRDAARALKLAARACKVTRWKDSNYLGTLAAAYANNGQFKEAISWQEKAITRAEEKKEKTELRAALKLYRAGQPYRLP
jgi:serine/threonine-protein kinase